MDSSKLAAELVGFAIVMAIFIPIVGLLWGTFIMMIRDWRK